MLLPQMIGSAESAMNVDSEGRAPPEDEEASNVCETGPGQSFNSTDLGDNQLDEYDTQTSQSVLLSLNDLLLLSMWLKRVVIQPMILMLK